MLTLRFAVRIFAIGVMIMGAGQGSAQDYPNKPFRVVAAQAGGGGDFVARLIAQGLTSSLGQQAIVDNRVAIIAIETVAKAPSDGYTLLVMSNLLWNLPLMQTTQFDPVKDFSPISSAAISPNILVVHPSVPVESVSELIALAKNKPGELNYGTSGVGATNHLAAELFKAMTGVNIVRINYKGGGPLTIGLLGGEVHLSFASAGEVTRHVKSNKLRALAITSAQPSALFSGLPTVAATVPGYENVARYGMFAPARTPGSVINRLNQEMAGVLARADVKERLLNAGVEAVTSSPADLGATMKSEMARLGKVIKDAGIRTE